MTARTADRVRRPRTAATNPAAADVGSQGSPGGTAHQAPTEAEIRAEVLEAGTVYPKGHPYAQELEEIIKGWATPLASAAFDALESPDERTPGDDTGLVLWRDLRPSEAIVLRGLVADAVRRATDRCQILVLEELTAAGVGFAAAFPDAPRVRPPVR
jgi:hypothetical protein